MLQSLAKRLKMCKDKVYAINQLKEITDWSVDKIFPPHKPMNISSKPSKLYNIVKLLNLNSTQFNCNLKPNLIDIIYVFA